MYIKPWVAALIGSVMASPALYASEDMTMFHAFRLEAGAGQIQGNKESLSSWDLDGWIGGDNNKLWIKSEGDVVESRTEQSESWGMYSRNIATFWDWQAGVRYDSRPQNLAYLVTGFTGLAPHFFETEAHLFISEKGDVSLRLREENDFLFTQQLILQPFIGLEIYAQDVPELNTGAGISNANLGLQLRYEFTRKIAPYLEFSHDQRLGQTADIYKQFGQDRSENSITAGLRLIF